MEEQLGAKLLGQVNDLQAWNELTGYHEVEEDDALWDKVTL